MKLLTQEITKKLPRLYATKDVPKGEKVVICKFFNSCGQGTWYAIEGQEEGDDFIFFGLVDLFEKEMGYFSLGELESARLPFGLKIERDIHFEGCKLSDLL